MVSEEDICGATFFESSMENRKCVQTLVSDDRKRLVRIYEMSDASHRVEYFTRGTDYNWAGEIWGQAKPYPSSITDSFEQAHLLASSFLKFGAA